MRLSNKVAVVTGAGSGMGKAISLLFASEGASIIGADMNIAGGQETVSIIRKNGGKAEFVPANVTLAADAENLSKTALSKFGKIDILMNIAGIMQKETAFEDIEESAWDKIYAVNVKGIFLVSKYVVPVMKKAGGGVIINMSSTIGFRVAPFRAAYASTKGAVITLSKAMAFELASNNIRVNYLTPGLTDTPMLSQFSEEERKMIVGSIHLGRMIKTDDVAKSALFLASDEASMITGSSINVDGGLSL